jgi:hypothetical protein
MILDSVADLVRRVLAIFPPDTAQVLFLPVFVATVMIGFVLIVHKLAAPLTRLAATLITWVITGAGAFLLLLDMVVADVCRRRGAKPPSVVYNLGDVVASWAVGLTGGTRQMLTSAAGVMARANVLLLIVVCGGWIWLWNDQYCPDGAAGCARPLSVWYEQVTSEQG